MLKQLNLSQFYESMRSLELVLITLILVYGVLFLCLPIPISPLVAEQYPLWANRIAFHKVVLHEILFIIWIIIFGWRYLLHFLLKDRSLIWIATICLIALAIWCGIMSLSAPLPWHDLGRTFRLLLNAALLIAVVKWTRQMPNYTMGMIILGFFIGTMINLIVSFQIPYINNGIFRLSGQNTAGVAMAIAIHLAAWLYFRTQNKFVEAFAVLTTIFFLFGVCICFSRVAWIIGAFGMIGWTFVLIFKSIRNPINFGMLRTMNFGMLGTMNFRTIHFWPALVFGFELFLISQINLLQITEIVSPNLTNVHSKHWKLLSKDGKVAKQKNTDELGEVKNYGLLEAHVIEKFGKSFNSNSVRWSYVIGTFEILFKHPLGVGYSGFFDAMKATDIYKSGKAAREASNEEANPHSTFLWYAIAGGIPGLILSLGLFLLLLNNLRIGLVADMGWQGLVLFSCIVLPYLLIGLIVPYIFNSIILIAPVAVAFGWSELKQT